MTTMVLPSLDLKSTGMAAKLNLNVGESDIYIPSGTLAELTRNFASAAVEGVVVGAPVVSAASTRFTGNSNYVNTQIDDSANITVIAIAKRPAGFAAVDAMAASNNGSAGGTDIGTSLWYFANGNIGFAAARNNGSGGQTSAVAQITPADPTAWALVIGEAGTVNKITNMTTNQTASSGTSTARFVAPAKMRIGSGYQSVHAGQIDIMITVVVPRVLTTAERDSVVAQLRDYALRFGVTV